MTWGDTADRVRSRLPVPVCAALLTFVSVSACSSTGACYIDATPAQSLRSIYVVRRGWHTGIIVAAADWPKQNRAVLAHFLEDFPDVDYLEFGWGDERFYQAEKNTVWMGSRAALWPTSSVIHVIGLHSPVARDAAANELVEIRVPIDGLQRLAQAIEDEFAGDSPMVAGPGTPLAPEPNRFYKAESRFYFPRMCNWWIARRLQEAGCPIQPWSVVTASRVIREARGFQRARAPDEQPQTMNRSQAPYRP